MFPTRRPRLLPAPQSQEEFAADRVTRTVAILRGVEVPYGYLSWQEEELERIAPPSVLTAGRTLQPWLSQQQAGTNSNPTAATSLLACDWLLPAPFPSQSSSDLNPKKSIVACLTPISRTAAGGPAPATLATSITPTTPTTTTTPTTPIAPQAARDLASLPAELHELIFEQLKNDQVASTCLALVSRQLYEHHWKMHGKVGLDVCDRHLVCHYWWEPHYLLNDYLKEWFGPAWGFDRSRRIFVRRENWTPFQRWLHDF